MTVSFWHSNEKSLYSPIACLKFRIMQLPVLSPTLLTTNHSGGGMIYALDEARYSAWHAKQGEETQQWFERSGYKAKPGKHTLFMDAKNKVHGLMILPEKPDIWSIAALTELLPQGAYKLHIESEIADFDMLALGWLLGCYRFETFKTEKKLWPQLLCENEAQSKKLLAIAEALCTARELINLPANMMGPDGLSEAAKKLGKKYQAEVSECKGKALLEQNYPLIHTVGRASVEAPRLVSLYLPKGEKPKIALIGKGVCFDSGGLDVKTSSGMKNMKKDMGGAACALALMALCADAGLSIDLTVYLPIVENAISGNAMRPLDIVRSRKGLTVEIGNTDAEGRLILCDAMTAAVEQSPDLLIDFATLTGAARVALGTDMPAFFTRHDALAKELENASQKVNDPLWRLPLHKPYREMLNSPNADISNDPESGMGGAITAALFLAEFVPEPLEWLHIDLMAWNMKARPGRPAGGEAMAVRAVFELLQQRYG